jgi:peptidoglycan/LPS O-acetylase OafA/YrhL
MRKLRSLEMLRGIAALLVVLYHTQSIFFTHYGATAFRGIFSAGSRGVDLFFVLSGFIIAHVHWADVGRPWRLRNYAFNRIARIYPAVWIMTAFAIVIYATGFGGHEKAAKLTDWGVISGALLLPYAGDALVNVTWTLKYEIFFYLIFATLILDRRVGVALLGAWQGAVLIVSLFVSPHLMELSGFYFRSLCLEFSIGLGCAVLVGSPGFLTVMRHPPIQWGLLSAGVAAFIAGMATDSLTDSAGIFCAIGAGAIIIGLIALEHSGRIKVSNTLVFFGGASYSIYLVHFSAITLFAVLLGHVHALPLNNAVFGLAAAFGVSIGVAFDQLVDRPIQRLLRKRIKPALLRPQPVR